MVFQHKEHLKDCNNNPTVGLLARRKYITKKPMDYPVHASRNIHHIEKQPEIESLNNSLKNKINELYPKTKQIRQYIINSDRVVLDEVKRSKKYTIFNKLTMILKRFI